MPIPIIIALATGGIGGFVAAKGTDALGTVLKTAVIGGLAFVVWKELR